MSLFDFLKKGIQTSKHPESSKSPEPSISCSLRFADSSSISPDERPYYQNDSYYTFYSHPNTPMARKVVTFEERKMTAFPSLNGLYPAEILLLSYCAKGTYPKPKSGYPGLWWFEYGIRDVGHTLESLEKRGFVEWAPKSAKLKNLKVDELKSILQAAALPTKGKKADLVARVIENIPESRIAIPDYTPKYRLTSLGESELEDNGYVPYMHTHKRKTTEDDRFGETFNVWSVNREFQDGDARNWRSVVGAIETRIFGMDIANSAPPEKPVYSIEDIRQYLESQKGFISGQIKTPGDGFVEEMRGIGLKESGRDGEALVQFFISVGKQLDAPALYSQTAILLRKYKLYELEVKVLEAGIRNVAKDNKKHQDRLKERLIKAKALAAKHKR